MSPATSGYLAAIDAGGTSFKCALAAPDGTIMARKRIATLDPHATIETCSVFLQNTAAEHNIHITALGIAAFGPVDIEPGSATYGTILTTPKPAWSATPLRAMFAERLGVRVHVDTDVNGALAAEMKWGAARDVASAAYITVGTGIGAGIYTGGQFLGRPAHPEFGHIYVKRHTSDTAHEGTCVFHSDCLEGLASATAFTARHGDPTRLPEDHVGWQIVASYLAQACIALALTTRLDRIILGGGLMQAPGIHAKIRAQFLQLNAGYLPGDRETIDAFIAAPELGDDAGLKGAILIGMRAAT